MIQANKKSQIALLGATGTIGDNTLDVIRQHPDKYRVHTLAANKSVAAMCALCHEFTPEYAALCDDQAAHELAAALSGTGLSTKVLGGAEAIDQAASHEAIDVVVAAIVGGAGLTSTFAAAKHGKRLLLANKEALVMAGKLLIDVAKLNHAEIIPVDSEHNAIFQLLAQRDAQKEPIKRLILTASGGPFLQYSPANLAGVTPAQAMAHPNWRMGPKISIDSATMMNKVLEIIEAYWLFSVSPEQIEVLIHPQSIVHSLVEFADGSQLAQLGAPDMKIPIAHALAYPERIVSGAATLDLSQNSPLTFQAPDHQLFRCLPLAWQALQRPQENSIVLNAANEIAVEAFMHGVIRFDQIAEVNQSALEHFARMAPVTAITDVFQADQDVRDWAKQYLHQGVAL